MTAAGVLPESAHCFVSENTVSTDVPALTQAECDVYYKLFQLYYGLDSRNQLDGHIANYFLSREDVFPLPDGAKLLRSHAEVVDAIRQHQIRDAGNAWIYGLCFKGY